MFRGGTGGARSPRGDDVIRFGLFYFLFFASVGVYAPWVPPLLEHHGLDARSIGLALAAASIIRAVTPPLWGVGLFKDVNGHQRLLHDGRANGVLEAVLWHGGEAQRAKDQVLKFSKQDRDALVAFVNSL